MSDAQGLPAAALSDDDLEREGLRAHSTRHWVFLHGSAEQFRTHTRRMLELEEEYLRRHPQRTWQGVGGSDGTDSPITVGITRVRDLVGLVQFELSRLIDASVSNAAEHVTPQESNVDDPAVWVQILARFAAAPRGSLHKLEAHQLSRQLAPNASVVAALYRHHPPLLRVDRDYREITDAGRAWLLEHEVR